MHKNKNKKKIISDAEDILFMFGQAQSWFFLSINLIKVYYICRNSIISYFSIRDIVIIKKP